MNDLIKGALVRIAIAAVVAAGVGSLTGSEREHGIRTERAAATENPRCAPRPVKMPCLLGERDAHGG